MSNKFKYDNISGLVLKGQFDKNVIFNFKNWRSKTDSSLQRLSENLWYDVLSIAYSILNENLLIFVKFFRDFSKNSFISNWISKNFKFKEVKFFNLAMDKGIMRSDTSSLNIFNVFAY